jgi:hypothetical protein
MSAHTRAREYQIALDVDAALARRAEESVAEEAAGALDATDKDISIGGAGLAAAAIELGPARA